jgi:hypothetical protein
MPDTNSSLDLILAATPVPYLGEKKLLRILENTEYSPGFKKLFFYTARAAAYAELALVISAIPEIYKLYHLLELIHK